MIYKMLLVSLWACEAPLAPAIAKVDVTIVVFAFSANARALKASPAPTVSAEPLLKLPFLVLATALAMVNVCLVNVCAITVGMVLIAVVVKRCLVSASVMVMVCVFLATAIASQVSRDSFARRLHSVLWDAKDAVFVSTDNVAVLRDSRVLRAMKLWPFPHPLSLDSVLSAPVSMKTIVTRAVVLTVFVLTKNVSASRATLDKIALF